VYELGWVQLRLGMGLVSGPMLERLKDVEKFKIELITKELMNSIEMYYSITLRLLGSTKKFFLAPLFREKR
jgi:hypothetical protein